MPNARLNVHSSRYNLIYTILNDPKIGYHSAAAVLTRCNHDNYGYDMILDRGP